MWSDPIHKQDVVDELLARVQGSGMATAKRLQGLLMAMSEELKDVPLFYYLPDLASTLHSIVPPVIDIHSALINAGYRVSQFHHEPYAVKTDAPPQVVWDIMRSFCALHPPTGSKHRKNHQVADLILAKPIVTQVDFTPVQSVIDARALEVARFPPNPEENWGPKARAGSKMKKAKVDEAEETTTSAGADDGQEEEASANKKMKK